MSDLQTIQDLVAALQSELATLQSGQEDLVSRLDMFDLRLDSLEATAQKIEMSSSLQEMRLDTLEAAPPPVAASAAPSSEASSVDLSAIEERLGFVEEHVERVSAEFSTFQQDFEPHVVKDRVSDHGDRLNACEADAARTQRAFSSLVVNQRLRDVDSRFIDLETAMERVKTKLAL